MNRIVGLKNCSGCYACVNSCPQNCITMKEDKDGFWYPEINNDLCVDCGLCEKICPVLKEYEGNSKGKAYACINKDENIRMKSSSGGVFTLLAEFVLDKGGVVFGAAFDNDFSVKHIAVDNIEELGKLRDSKYLQSKIGDTYKQAKAFLDSGRWVLFSGTPCQISGLKAYLGKSYENLIMQDIICHGVPSPKVWDRYIEYKEKSIGTKIKNAKFRHKKDGEKSYFMRLDFEDVRSYVKKSGEDSYMKVFLSNLCLRPSCYDCHSKSLERESDITLADFWGIEKVAPDMDDGKGISLVMVNSKKGEKIFSAIKDKMIWRQVDIDKATEYNPSAFRSVCKPTNRNKFMRDIFTEDFEKTAIKYTRIGFKTKILRKLKKIIKKTGI